MFFVRTLIRRSTVGIFSLALFFGAVTAVAQDAQAPAAAPAPAPEPVPVTCPWNGASAQHDANCAGTQRRQVLNCTDGTTKVGICIK